MIITPGLKPYFKLAALLGLGAMVFDTWLSGKFGYSISLDMAGIFGLVSLASGVLLVIAAAFWKAGHEQIGRYIAYAWVPVFAFNIFSNMGVATANRMTDVQQASIQAARYDGAQAKVVENRELLKGWKARLAKLKAENEWAATVTADALRARLPALELAIAQEAKRGGCGPRCLARTQERDDVQAKIATAEDVGDLTKRIAATQRLVDGYTDTAANTKAGVSHAANQSKFFAKLASFSLYADPTAADVGVANEGMGMFTAIVLAIVSALLTYVGAYPHLMELGSLKSQAPRPNLAPRRSEDNPAYTPEPVALMPQARSHEYRPVRRTIGDKMRDLESLATA